MKLVIGNKNYSSWSLRPWLLFSYFDLEFEEINIQLFNEGMREKMQGICPAYKVPALIIDDIQVWDSLAICQFINEEHLDGKAMPAHAKLKAFSLSACAEMHSGFNGIRSELPMNIRAEHPLLLSDLSELCQNDIQRVIELLSQALELSAINSSGYLLGEFGIIDCMFMPIMSRFNTYHIKLPEPLTRYQQKMLNEPAFIKWKEVALKEKEVIELDERGYLIENNLI
ncbi:glutathione S-transferase family protein [Marinicellulosiphila megalodicopiae]|uniref:glutathione S-transferase family protein n=1 Tax=Marinicellulosiphila megalodicopiae TaxID=2724896 RepID=UPI003BAFF393